MSSQIKDVPYQSIHIFDVVGYGFSMATVSFDSRFIN